MEFTWYMTEDASSKKFLASGFNDFNLAAYLRYDVEKQKIQILQGKYTFTVDIVKVHFHRWYCERWEKQQVWERVILQGESYYQQNIQN